MKKIAYSILIAAVAIMGSCGKGSRNAEAEGNRVTKMESLRDTLVKIANEYPGEIGIAVIPQDGDAIVANDKAEYPLMSVFKLHQAIALCDRFEKQGISLDTVVTISDAQLNPETWSPMLKDHSERPLRLPVRELLRYTLTQSDNNASNYMFETLCSVAATDSMIATLVPRSSFRLAVSEARMWKDHSRSRENRSSPSGAAILIERLFTDSTVCPANREFICSTLRECKTGADRIVAPLAAERGVTVAHKTGSGFRDADGRLAAHNDVAFITLPDGRYYTLAVLVKDFQGSEAEASKAISEISEVVYRNSLDL